MLQVKLIKEQLVFFPNGSKVISSWIVIAGDLLDAVIVHDEIPLSDMPPVLQSRLEDAQTCQAASYMKEIKVSMLNAVYQELIHVTDFLTLPDKDLVCDATMEFPVIWDIIHVCKEPHFNHYCHTKSRKRH